MHRHSPTPAYRDHPFAEIVKGRASTHTHRGDRYELRWLRHLYDDGDVVDTLRQQHWDRHGVRKVADLAVGYSRSTAEQFAELVELYRKIAAQDDGLPPPGQITLPGLS